jgi:hypothetical protein
VVSEDAESEGPTPVLRIGRGSKVVWIVASY